MPDLASELLKAALALPGVEKSVACKGTSLEARTAIVRKKAFLFAGKEHVRLKLGASLKEARALEAKSPESCSAGSGGWVKLTIAGPKLPSLPILRRWVRESYAIFGGGK